MTNNYKFIFFGTPEFAAIILEKLIKAGWAPAVVVCNPDRPVGRKKIITSPPTKLLAIKYKIPVLQPAILSTFNFQLSTSNFDFGIVTAYGKIIPKEILSLPRFGIIGVHPSLLPKYRGPSPIQTAILNGDAETGVTLFLMDEKIDHGPILRISNFPAKGETRHRRQFPISNLTYTELNRKLAEMAANLLIETLPKWLNGEIKSIPQNENQAVYTKKFITEDGFIDLKKDNPAVIERKIKALNPEPGVYTFMKLSGLASKEKRVKLLEAELKDGKLFITKIQAEGQKPQFIKIGCEIK